MFIDKWLPLATMKEVITSQACFLSSHTAVFQWRNTSFENKNVPLTSSSSHKTGLGCCYLCLVLCCSNSRILLHLQKGNKKAMFNQAKPISPYQRAADTVRQFRGCWSKMQHNIHLHLPVSCLEQLRGTWGLPKAIQVIVCRYVLGRNSGPSQGPE